MGDWSRRRVIKSFASGAATAVALPLLDCFLDGNGEAMANGLAIPVRFGTWFWPGGVTASRFFPAAGDAGFTLRQETTPLRGVRDKITIFSGFEAKLGETAHLAHWTGVQTALSGSAPSRDRDHVVNASTLDWLVSNHFSAAAPLRLACTADPRVGYSARADCLAERSEIDPREVYRHLFAPTPVTAATNEHDVSAMLRTSVLSPITEERAALHGRLGAVDRARLDRHFTKLRELELRLAQSEVVVGSPASHADLEPATLWRDAASRHEDFADLLVLALATGRTQVFTLALSSAVSNLQWNRSTPSLHDLTHDEPIDAAVGHQKEVAMFREAAIGAFGSLLDKLNAVPEGAGTLLDHSLVLALSDSGDARTHTLTSLPMIVAGTANGRWRSGRHIAGDGDTVSRVGLTVQQALGMPVTGWGTGANATDRPIPETLAV